MDVKWVKWGAGVFICGALNQYVWIRPGFNSTGLQSLVLGGLWSLAAQAVATKIMITIYASDSKKENLSTGAFFITVLASIPIAVSMARHWGIQVGYKEAASLAVVSAITNFVALGVLNF